MAKKQIKRIEMSYGNKKSFVLGIELPDGNFLLETGAYIRNNYVGKVSQTRVSADVKKVFYDMYDTYLKIQKLEKERDNIIHQIYEQRHILSNMPDQIQKAKGLLTYNEFVGIFANALPAGLKNEINRYDYVYDSPMGICYSSDESVYISRFEDIQKYYHGILVEQEYDGTYHMAYDCKNHKEYKRLMKVFSKPLSVKQKIKEGLTLGDKDWLSYTGYYQIPIKKEMTHSYAVELANKFAAR